MVHVLNGCPAPGGGLFVFAFRHTHPSRTTHQRGAMLLGCRRAIFGPTGTGSVGSARLNALRRLRQERFCGVQGGIGHLFQSGRSCAYWRRLHGICEQAPLLPLTPGCRGGASGRSMGGEGRDSMSVVLREPLLILRQPVPEKFSARFRRIFRRLG